MDMILSREFAHVPDLWHQVRNLHWFRSSFSRGADTLARHINIRIEVDQGRSTLAFLNWAEKLSLKERNSPYDAQDLCVFSCGLLLAELIRTAPVKLLQPRHPTCPVNLPVASQAIAEFWPEGFILTSYCASVLEAILRQNLQATVTFSPAATEIRTWWSFRENAQEDPVNAIGFFDLFLGREPHWQGLELPWERAETKSEIRHEIRPRLP